MSLYSVHWSEEQEEEKEGEEEQEQEETKRVGTNIKHEQSTTVSTKPKDKET